MIYRLSAVFIFSKFADLLRLTFIADSMISASSTLQIQGHDYFGHSNFVKSIGGFVIILFYAINSDVASLFTNLSFLVSSELEYIIILNDLLYKFKLMKIVIFY
jgi:hypothetical protein